MDLLDTLKKYGSDSLGYPSEKTIKLMLEKNPELPSALGTLLLEPSPSLKAMLLHEEVEHRKYLPILEEYIPYLQAMIGNRYTKAYSVGEAVVKLEKLGFTISSKGQLSNIWNRAETKLGLADKRRAATKDTEERNAEARAQGKSCTKLYTAERKKQLDSARKISAAKRSLAKAEKERAAAKKSLARQAAKTGKTLKELKDKQETNLKTTADMEQIKANIAATGKKVLYEPTPKQAEFHSADEDIVLYGGAAG